MDRTSTRNFIWTFQLGILTSISSYPVGKHAVANYCGKRNPLDLADPGHAQWHKLHGTYPPCAYHPSSKPNEANRYKYATILQLGRGTFGKTRKLLFLKASAATIQTEVQLHVPLPIDNWVKLVLIECENHLWFHHGIRMMWEWNLTMSENQNQLTNNSSISMYMDVSWLLKGKPRCPA